MKINGMLAKTDNGNKGITDKGFKMLGVTSMYKAGATLEEVGLHGRWRTAETSLRYKHNSVDYKMGCRQRFHSECQETGTEVKFNFSYRS